jgi:hypothetical protein
MFWEGGTAYFATVISYPRNMFMKSTAGVNVKNVFAAVSHKFL